MLPLILCTFLSSAVQAASWVDGPPPDQFIVQPEDARFLEPDTKAGRFDLNSKGLIFLMKNEPSPKRPIIDPYVEFDKTHDPPNGNVVFDKNPKIDRSFENNYELRQTNRKRGPKRPAENIGDNSIVKKSKRPKVYTYLEDLLKQGFEIIDPGTANQLKHRNTVEVSGDYIRYNPQDENKKRNNPESRRQSNRRDERINRKPAKPNRPERRNRPEKINRSDRRPDRRNDSRRPDRRNDNRRQDRRNDSKRQDRRNDNRRPDRRNDNRRPDRRNDSKRQDRRNDSRRPDWRDDSRRKDSRRRPSTHSNSIVDRHDEIDALWRDANDELFGRKDW